MNIFSAIKSYLGRSVVSAIITLIFLAIIMFVLSLFFGGGEITYNSGGQETPSFLPGGGRPIEEKNAPQNREVLFGLWKAEKYMQLDEAKKTIIYEGDYSGDPTYLGFGEGGICFEVYQNTTGDFICFKYIPYELKGSVLALNEERERTSNFTVYLRDELLEAFISDEGQSGMRFRKIKELPPAALPPGDYPETIRGPGGLEIVFDRTSLRGTWRGTHQVKIDRNTRATLSSSDFGPGSFPPHVSFGEKGFCFDVFEQKGETYCRKYIPYMIGGAQINPNYNTFSPSESLPKFSLEWRSGKLEMFPHSGDIKFVLEKVSEEPLNELAGSDAESGAAPFLYCGDNVCGFNEDTFICPADCGAK